MLKTISQTELNRNFKKYEKLIKSESVIVYKNNEPAFVTLPLEVFSELMNIEEDEINNAIKRYMEIKQGKAKSIDGKKAWDLLEGK